MALEMKTWCEICGRDLAADSEAYVCSYECTYCEKCSANLKGVCPNCGGELNRRPRRAADPVSPGTSQTAVRPLQSGLIWISSFGVWSLVSILAGVSIFQFYRARNISMGFWENQLTQFCQILPYALLTPFVLALAARYPVTRQNWLRRSGLYLICGLLFCVAHITIRGATPYAYWDPKVRAWHSAMWDYKTHSPRMNWLMFEDLFYSNVVDDITGAFVPIILVGHMLSYYSKLRERERRTAQLEAQLSKANLHALKSQLQPHFLFNTMHSISGLMFADVHAADKMMTRLSELLRMTLQDGAAQLTTLDRELDFVSRYLDIEKMRLGERLSIVHDISPDTLDAQVPHLLLQPLVENSIQHGIAKITGNGEIRIASRHEDNSLFLTVTDNGPGFQNTNGKGTKPGVGIRATQERLRTLYGDQHSLNLATLSSGGAEVTIRLPFRPIPDKD